MSSTFRRLPVYCKSRGLKSFVARINPSLRRHGRTIWYHQTGRWNDPDSRDRRWIIAGGYWVWTTEEDVATALAEDRLHWCRKNKTCRRQRRHAVRAIKQIATRIECRRLERTLATEVADQGDPLPSAIEATQIDI